MMSHYMQRLLYFSIALWTRQLLTASITWKQLSEIRVDSYQVPPIMKSLSETKVLAVALLSNFPCKAGSTVDRGGKRQRELSLKPESRPRPQPSPPNPTQAGRRKWRGHRDEAEAGLERSGRLSEDRRGAETWGGASGAARAQVSALRWCCPSGSWSSGAEATRTVGAQVGYPEEVLEICPGSGLGPGLRRGGAVEVGVSRAQPRAET